MTPTPTIQLLPTPAGHDISPIPTQWIYGPFHTHSEASGAEAVNRSSIAALAFLVWDILITFDDEVKHIWPRTWNYTKCVYFFVRYIPVIVEASILCIGSELTPLFHFTQHDCFIWQVYQAAAVTLVIVAVDTILILRVYALFKNSPLIYNILRVAFVVEVIGMVLGIILAIPKVRYNDVCLVLEAPKTFGLWLISLLFQILLFSLTAYRFYRTLRAGLGNIPLLTVIMRDGTWAFTLLFLIYAGYAILVALPHHSYSGVLFGWMLAAFSFAGYRIILNLHQSGPTHQTTTTAEPSNRTTRQTSTEIQFTSHHIATEPDSYQLTETTFTTKTSQTAGQASGLSGISMLQLEP